MASGQRENSTRESRRAMGWFSHKQAHEAVLEEARKAAEIARYGQQEQLNLLFKKLYVLEQKNGTSEDN